MNEKQEMLNCQKTAAEKKLIATGCGHFIGPENVITSSIFGSLFYTFPAGMLNSVMSVSHFMLGASAWKFRCTRLGTAGLISPA